MNQEEFEEAYIRANAQLAFAIAEARNPTDLARDRAMKDLMRAEKRRNTSNQSGSTVIDVPDPLPKAVRRATARAQGGHDVLTPSDPGNTGTSPRSRSEISKAERAARRAGRPFDPPLIGLRPGPLLSSPRGRSRLRLKLKGEGPGTESLAGPRGPLPGSRKPQEKPQKRRGR